MSRIWLSVLCGAALACTGRAPLPPRAVELNESGARALAEGDLETADARLSVALEYSPHFVEALVNLGLVEVARGNFTRARTLLERARRLNPDVAQPHHALGILSERERRPDQASQHYRDALAVDPGLRGAGQPGPVALRRGPIRRRAARVQEADGSRPEAAVGHSGLAESLLRLGRVAEAERVIDAASKRFPDDGALVLLRARSALRHGEPERARALLLPSARPATTSRRGRCSWLAVVELSQGHRTEAERFARRSLLLDPEDGLARHVLLGTRLE